MNQNPSTPTSVSSSNSTFAESISRRAYELWEQEGRPEGNDMRHWLQAEQEIAGRNGGAPSSGSGTTRSEQARQQVSDARPLQGTRAGAAANREGRRTSASPFGDKPAPGQQLSKLDTAGNRRRN